MTALVGVSAALVLAASIVGLVIRLAVVPSGAVRIPGAVRGIRTISATVGVVFIAATVIGGTTHPSLDAVAFGITVVLLMSRPLLMGLWLSPDHLIAVGWIGARRIPRAHIVGLGLRSYSGAMNRYSAWLWDPLHRWFAVIALGIEDRLDDIELLITVNTRRTSLGLVDRLCSALGLPTPPDTSRPGFRGRHTR